MNIPLWLLMYLPEKVQEKQIRKRWSKKTDNEILGAFEDSTEWIDISLGIMESKTTKGIAQTCFKRLDKYILPEIRDRGLFSK